MTTSAPPNVIIVGAGLAGDTTLTFQPLDTLFPRTWMPLCAIVTPTTMPYAQALAHSKQQDTMLKGVSVGLVALLFLLFRDLLLCSLSRMRFNQH